MGDTPTSNEHMDRDYAAQLKQLHDERAKLLTDAKRRVSRYFSHLGCQVELRMKIATEYRDMQLRNVRHNFDIEVQQAWNEFERGKRRLHSAMLDVSAERRKRVDGLRTAAPGVRKKRRGRGASAAAAAAAAAQAAAVMVQGWGSGAERSRAAVRRNEPFVMSLEEQGWVRVALTPDEVNMDLEHILRATCTVQLCPGRKIEPKHDVERKGAHYNQLYN